MISTGGSCFAQVCKRLESSPMLRLRLLPLFALLALSLSAAAQLSTQITRIAAEAQGRVGVACSLPGTPLDCNLHAADTFPMQSVYKLPIAMAALHAVEQGRLTLDQKVRFLPSDLPARDEYSPLRDEYPHANVDIPLEDLLRRAVSESDNAACDLVLRLLARPGVPDSGPSVVTRYLHSVGLTDITVVDSEKVLDSDEHLQYRNSATPRALVELLRRLADRSPLSAEHTRLLLGWMTATHTADQRVRALLPPGTVSADKTGTSGQGRAVMNATNDIALMTLPDGRRVALAVLVADARAPYAARERVIAQIARAVYEAAVQDGRRR